MIKCVWSRRSVERVCHLGSINQTVTCIHVLHQDDLTSDEVLVATEDNEDVLVDEEGDVVRS